MAVVSEEEPEGVVREVSDFIVVSFVFSFWLQLNNSNIKRRIGKDLIFY